MFLYKNKHIKFKNMNLLQSKSANEDIYWEGLSEESKLEITNLFIEKDAIDLLEKYKTLSNIELIELVDANIDKIKINELKLSIYRIINLIGSKIFLSIDIEKIEEYFVLNSFGEYSISEEYVDLFVFGFTYTPHMYMFTSMPDFLYFTKLDFDSVYERLLNPIVIVNSVVYTYLMTDASGYIKIGKSANIDKRLKTLAIGNPTIRVIASLADNIECQLHKRFSNKRIIGEWFSLNDKDLDTLAEQYGFQKE